MDATNETSAEDRGNSIICAWFNVSPTRLADLQRCPDC